VPQASLPVETPQVGQVPQAHPGGRQPEPTITPSNRQYLLPLRIKFRRRRRSRRCQAQKTNVGSQALPLSVHGEVDEHEFPVPEVPAELGSPADALDEGRQGGVSSPTHDDGTGRLSVVSPRFLRRSSLDPTAGQESFGESTPAQPTAFVQREEDDPGFPIPEDVLAEPGSAAAASDRQGGVSSPSLDDGTEHGERVRERTRRSPGAALASGFSPFASRLSAVSPQFLRRSSRTPNAGQDSFGVWAPPRPQSFAQGEEYDNGFLVPEAVLAEPGSATAAPDQGRQGGVSSPSRDDGTEHGERGRGRERTRRSPSAAFASGLASGLASGFSPLASRLSAVSPRFLRRSSRTPNAGQESFGESTPAQPTSFVQREEDDPGFPIPDDVLAEPGSAAAASNQGRQGGVSSPTLDDGTGHDPRGRLGRGHARRSPGAVVASAISAVSPRFLRRSSLTRTAGDEDDSGLPVPEEVPAEPGSAAAASDPARQGGASSPTLDDGTGHGERGRGRERTRRSRGAAVASGLSAVASGLSAVASRLSAVSPRALNGRRRRRRRPTPDPEGVWNNTRSRSRERGIVVASPTWFDWDSKNLRNRE
jgi:hypothetical protein